MQNIRENAWKRYTWIALYTDGSQIAQFDDPDGLGFASIDQNRVRRLFLSANETGKVAFAVDVPSGARPVFFWRHQTVIGFFGEDQGMRVVHCIGWMREQEAVYLFVFRDGSTLLTSDLQAV